MKTFSIDKLIQFMGGLVALTLFAKESLSSFVFIAFMLLLVFQIIINKEKRVLFVKCLNNRFVIALISYYFLTLIGVLINPDSKTDYLIRLMPFFLASLIIFYNKTSRRGFSIFIKTFILGNLLLLLFLDFFAIYDMINNNSLFVELDGRKYYRFLYTRYTRGDYFHHIYLSAYTFLSMVLIHQFRFLNNKIKWISTIYFLIHLYMLGSRAVVISMIIASFLFLLIASIKNIKYLKYLTLLGLSLLVLFGTAYIFKDTRLFNRYSQVYEWYGKRDQVLERNYSINKRIKIYIVGSSFFKTKSFQIDGTGIADNEIRKRYNEKFKDSFNFKTETYNAHNQYINNFIDWGYLGVFVLLVLLYFLIYDAAKKKYLWIMFFWLFFAVLLTMESFFIRQRGILLFIIIGSLFISKENKEYIVKNE